MSDTNLRPIAIDLFSGAGGMSLGFEQAGYDIAVAVEVDPIHCAVHERNFPATEVVCKSVSAVSGAEIRKLAKLGDRPVEVVFGGAPCQGFSLIGQRMLDDPRNKLVLDFVRLVRELDARYFVFENVKGITVGRHKKFLSELIDAFEADGAYNVVRDWKVLNATNYGVPQDRQRLFLMGARKGEPVPDYPKVTTARRPEDYDDDVVATPTCEEALGDLPDAEYFDELIDGDIVKAALGDASKFVKTLRGLSNNADDYSHPRVWDPSYLTSSLRTEHTEKSRERFADCEPGKVEPVSRFFKLSPDGVANTLRAGTDSQRGAFTSPRPIHYKHARCVTVREMARLHGYPDWFRFHVTKWHGARQIGNSVPPPLAKAVAGAVLFAGGHVPQRPTEALTLGDDELLTLNMEKAAAHFGVPRNTIPQRKRRNA